MSAANDLWESVGLGPDGGRVEFTTGRAACPCPVGPAGIRHLRATCTDPVVARLNWYADDPVVDVDEAAAVDQLAAVDRGQPDPPALPGDAWGRFSWTLITEIFALLDRAGYQRGSAAEVGQAVILLGDAVSAYEGRTLGRELLGQLAPSAAAPLDLRTPKQVRTQYGVSASTVRRWRLDGRLQAIPLPSGQSRYLGAEVDQLGAR
jgi:hypothetical protein